jgi:UDP-N-acetylglucosamine--N-acetylmuramyl-(pentapeptide) pyrophosphoryl-undecaprenol N-acetylglucosamine transferase
VNIVVAGGGTAGHVYPALAMADALRARHGAIVSFVGSYDGPESELVPAAGYPFTALRVVSAQKRVSMRSIGALRKTLLSSRVCRPMVARADAVVGIGGYASAPVALAARRAHRPLVVVEPNSVPGAVNRIAARWAAAIAVTFDATRAWLPAGVRIERTGNPIRPAIASVPDRRAELAKEAGVEFGLEEGRRTIVVLGGSQGALRLNELTREVAATLAGRGDLQILLATGPSHEATFAGMTGDEVLVRVVGTIDRMDLALAVADVAVSRAGAGHIAELAACGVPMILVPYPHATEHHQEANARELEEAGAAEVATEPDLTADVLSRRIVALLDDGPGRARMAEAAKRWARPDADARLADLVAQTAGGDGT